MKNEMLPIECRENGCKSSSEKCIICSMKIEYEPLYEAIQENEDKNV